MKWAAVTEKIKNRIKCKKGMTMVELIVTFALLAMFMVAAAQMITSSMKIYYHVRSVDYGKQVTDTLLDKIAGEIEGAQVASTVVTKGDSNAIGGRQDATLIVGNNGQNIDLYDRTGSRILISDEDDQIIIHYYEVYSDDSNTTVIRYEAVDWTFDPSAYMGYKVKSLHFSLPGMSDPDAYEKNIVKVDLTITSDRYGEYSATRYVRCYNFQTDDDMARIEGPGGNGEGGESGGEQGGDTTPTTNFYENRDNKEMKSFAELIVSKQETVTYNGETYTYYDYFFEKNANQAEQLYVYMSDDPVYQQIKDYMAKAYAIDRGSFDFWIESNRHNNNDQLSLYIGPSLQGHKEGEIITVWWYQLKSKNNSTDSFLGNQFEKKTIQICKDKNGNLAYADASGKIYEVK